MSSLLGLFVWLRLLNVLMISGTLVPFSSSQHLCLYLHGWFGSLWYSQASRFSLGTWSKEVKVFRSAIEPILGPDSVSLGLFIPDVLAVSAFLEKLDLATFGVDIEDNFLAIAAEALISSLVRHFA